MSDQIRTFQDVLNSIQQGLEKKKGDRAIVLATMTDLMARYEAASAVVDVAEIAARLGIETARAENTEELALAMMGALERLPEFQRLVIPAAPIPTTPEPKPKPQLRQAAAPEEEEEEEEEEYDDAPTVDIAKIDPASYRICVDDRAGTLRITLDPPFPLLAVYSQQHELVTIGGLYKVDRDRMIKEMGIRHDWIDTHNTGGDKIEALCQRVKMGGVGALVILADLCGKMNTRRLISACKIQPVTPYATAKNGTYGRFKIALGEIEQQLASPPALPAAKSKK